MRHPPPLIVGGGPAGAAAAIALARAGVSASLIERLPTPGDAICGGFMSWATLARLKALGIDADALAGHPVDRLALFVNGHMRDAALPASAMGISRRRLDQIMQQAARDAGAELHMACAVRSLDEAGLTLATGKSLPWDSLFLATGKHDLRGAARPHDADDPELGLRLRLPGDASLHRLVGGAIELHLFPRGYIGLVLQEDGTLNACMAVRKSVLAAAGGDPAGLFRHLADQSPALADRLATMPDRPAIDAIGHVPYGWRAHDTRPGLFRLGDQAAVIPSLAGEGIGIALASADSAVRHWLAAGRDGAQDHQRQFARRAARPLAIAGWAKQLGDHPRIARALAAVPGAAAIVASLTRIGRA